MLRVSDPLGLSAREVSSPPIDVLVLPRIEPVQRSGAGRPDGVGDVRGPSSARLTGALEVDGLRPHVPGAPASRIHWPTVARTGTLVERRLIEDVDLRPLIVMDPNNPSSEEALDQALRAAASLCVHLAPGSCALLLAGDRRATPIDADLRTWPAQHVRLALVSSHDGALWRESIERAATVLLWVSASSAPARWPRWRARARASASTSARTRSPAGRSLPSRVAGCSGQRVRGGTRRHALRAA